MPYGGFPETIRGDPLKPLRKEDCAGDLAFHVFVAAHRQYSHTRKASPVSSSRLSDKVRGRKIG